MVARELLRRPRQACRGWVLVARLCSHFAHFLPAFSANITPYHLQQTHPHQDQWKYAHIWSKHSQSYRGESEHKISLEINFSLIQWSNNFLFSPNKRVPGARCWPPPGFKWPLMALDGCSGSGSLKLGEALYETLLHLSPLLLPVTAYAYRPHNLKPLEQQGKLLEWHWKSNTGLWNHLKFQAGRHLCALYQYILLISQWDCLGD